MNNESFDECMKLARSFFIYNADDFYIQNRFNSMNKFLYENAVHPFTRRTSHPNSGYVEQTASFPNEKGSESESFYTGTFAPLFAAVELEFDAGDFKGYIKNTSTYKLTDFLKENEYFEEAGLGQEFINKPKVTLTALSCSDCVSKGYYDDGERCAMCDVEISEDDLNKAASDPNAARNESFLDNKKKEMLHTIATFIVPAIDDMEEVIADIETSVVKAMVQKEYDIIVNAKDKLKELNL
jgi:hypothetical protein